MAIIKPNIPCLVAVWNRIIFLLFIWGTLNVYAENIPIGRVGDPILQCTAVMKGSPNVFANGGGNAGAIEKFAKSKGLDTKNPNEMKNL